MKKNLYIAKKFRTAITVLTVSTVFFLFFLQSLFPEPILSLKTSAEAISTAQSNEQYLFLMFYENKGDAAKTMEKVVNSFKGKAADKILFHKTLTTDDKEKDIIVKYGINRAPLPVILVFAPNGAITGGFAQKVTEKELKGSIVSDLVMEILKTVQERKIALVLLQNSKTEFNKESLKAAQEFSDDSRLKGFVNIIKADPDNSKNNTFIENLQLKEKISEAITVFIVPPSTIAGVFKGKITKDTLLAALASCSSSGCGGSQGCAPNQGCGPKK